MKDLDLTLIGNSFAYLGVCIVLFLIGKIAFGIFNKQINVNHEIIKKDNLAFSISLIGYYTGIILAIGSALLGSSQDLMTDLISIASYGLGAIVLLNISSIINDKIIFREHNVNKEIIEDENIGVGLIEAANYIAVGVILYGASTGSASPLAILFFWLAAELALIIAAKFYNLITPYDIHSEIERDNIAVGVGYSGIIIALSIIISNGIAIETDSIKETLIQFAFTTVVGLILLPIIRIITDKIMLPGVNLNNEIANKEKPNVGAGLIECIAYITGSLLFVWCF
jgi:uncharacterized membrane protein YjfL (UPF0719 family)